MKNYGSDTYFAVAVLAGVGACGLFFYISENFISGVIVGSLVYVVYYWFSRVLYGLEQNGEVLSSISEQLEFIVSDGSLENQTNDEEARIEAKRIAEEERLRSEEEAKIKAKREELARLETEAEHKAQKEFEETGDKIQAKASAFLIMAVIIFLAIFFG